MTGRQEYDRTKDRQRTLGKYMINNAIQRYIVYLFKNGSYVFVKKLKKNTKITCIKSKKMAVDAMFRGSG
jgi:hypothetical protein